MADTSGMTRDAFYVALWIGALLFAADPTFDPFPAELDALAVAYFSRFPALAQA